MIWVKRLGWVWILVVAVAATLVMRPLLYKLWAACDVDRNDIGRNLVLNFVYSPITFLAVVGLGWVAYRQLSRDLTRRTLLAPVATLVIAVLVVWATLVWHRGDAMISPEICPTGVPSWWPSWVPI